MTTAIYSFCEECEMYHYDYKRNYFAKDYLPTHLDNEEKKDAKSFNVYVKRLHHSDGSLSDMCINMIQPWCIPEWVASGNEPFIYRKLQGGE